VIGILGLAAQLAVAVHAPSTVGVCDPMDVRITVRVPAGTVPRLVAPSLQPFEILRASPSPRVTADPADQHFALAEFTYVLAAAQTGVLTIPAFEVRDGASVGLSRPVGVTVLGQHALGAPGVVVRSQVDTSLDFNVHALAAPETVYVGQQANYEVAVFLSAAVHDQLRHNPTFFPPDIESMLAYDLPLNGDLPRRNVGSRCFQTLAFQRAIFPLVAGRFVVPPAELVYALPMAGGFFSREESHELETDSAYVVAIDPPAAGRPADYAGAVGDLHVTARLDTSSARVGDPVLLTVRVAGTGNVKLFPRPRVTLSWGTLVPGDERVRVDTAAWRVSGVKEFDWILTPSVAGEHDVPAIRYAFFDPDRRRYEVAVGGTEQLRVMAGTLASDDTLQGPQIMSLRPLDRGPAGTPLSQRPLFWVVLLAAPVPALGVRLRRRRRKAGISTTSRDALFQLADESANATGGAGAADASLIRRAYAGALAGRLGLRPEAFSRPGAVARALRRAGAPHDVADRAETFMRELDAAAFSTARTLPPDAVARAIALYTAADAESLALGEFHLPADLTVVSGFAALSILLVAAVPQPTGSFQRGVSAYRHHAFAAAEAAFGEAAAGDPRSPDLWADYGAAAWMAGDTARAVAGWQRAVRLDPTAPDLREHVELVHPLSISSAGFVAPVSPNWAFLAAAACWAIAWAIAAARAGRRKRMWSAGNVGLVCLGLVAGVWGAAERARLDGRTLAVVRAATGLSTDPAIGEAQPAVTATGDVVRVRGTSGAWSLIAVDDGHEGWVQSSDLIFLADPLPRAD